MNREFARHILRHKDNHVEPIWPSDTYSNNSSPALNPTSLLSVFPSTQKGPGGEKRSGGGVCGIMLTQGNEKGMRGGRNTKRLTQVRRDTEKLCREDSNCSSSFPLQCGKSCWAFLTWILERFCVCVCSDHQATLFWSRWELTACITLPNFPNVLHEWNMNLAACRPNVVFTLKCKAFLCSYLHLLDILSLHTSHCLNKSPMTDNSLYLWMWASSNICCFYIFSFSYWIFTLKKLINSIRKMQMRLIRLWLVEYSTLF